MRILNTKFPPFLPLVWLVLNLVLMSLLIFYSTPFSAIPVDLNSDDSEDEHGIVYKMFRYECQAGFFKTGSSTGLFSTMATLQCLILLRAAFMAFQFRLVSKRVKITTELKMSCNFIYCSIILLIAASIIALMNVSSGSSLLVVTSSFSFCYSLLGIVMLFAPKFLKQRIVHSDSSSDIGQTK